MTAQGYKMKWRMTLRKEIMIRQEKGGSYIIC